MKKLHLPRGHVLLERPLVMGILNVTPDSFSDGGCYDSVDRALGRARALALEGADLIDIGGESTRPGAASITLQEELDRVLPVLEAVRRELDVAVSIDTSKPELMQAAIRLGADMINDVHGLRAPGAIAAVADSGAAVCIMHMQGQPRSMQQNPQYEDVLGAVTAFLTQQAVQLERQGVLRERIVIDPGFGFGKNLDHNVDLFHGLSHLAALDYPLLVGISRKSMIGALLGGRRVDERAAGSVAAALLAVQSGANIVRVHDVRETVDALAIHARLGRSE
jgi:dihydropteroate synthase